MTCWRRAAPVFWFSTKPNVTSRNTPRWRRRWSTDSRLPASTYNGTAKVRHPLDVLINDIGMEKIKARIKKPLTGLKVAPYYGCQIVRPYATFDLMYYPVTMDKLLRAVGAEVVDYPLKTRCCGGSQKGTLPEVGLSLIHILLKEARRREAQIVSTICPLCQFNLDAFQDEASKKYGEISMPVVYFTQLLGLAFGFSAKELGLERNIVAAKQMLAKFAPAAAEATDYTDERIRATWVGSHRQLSAECRLRSSDTASVDVRRL